MTDLRKHAECVKLSILLRCQPDDLAFLQSLDLAAIRRLRQSIYHYLHHENRPLFIRLKKASSILPSSVAAIIAERTLGPLLCARVACEMTTERATDVARQLSPRFLALTVPHLDTLRAAELAVALPLSQILAVSKELTDRREFILMGNLVSELPTPLLEAILKDIHNGESLLRIAFFVENKKRLDDILEFLPTTQLKAVIVAAANEAVDLWPEALSLISEVSPRWQARLVNMAADEDESTLASMVHGVVKHSLWQIIVPLLHLMTEANRRRIVSLPSVDDDEVTRQLIQAATRYDLWQDVLPLIPLMPTDMHKRAARIVDDLIDTATMERLFHVCFKHRLWHAALPMLADMSDNRRIEVATFLGNSPEDLIESFHHEVRTHQLWLYASLLIACMPEALQARFASTAIFENESILHEIIDTTAQNGSWPLLIGMAGHAPETQQYTIARILETLDSVKAYELCASLTSGQQWITLFKLMTLMRPERRSNYVLQLANLDDSLLNDALYALNNAQQWVLLMDVLSGLPAYLHEQLLTRSRTLDRDLCIQLIDAATTIGRGDTSFRQIAELSPEEKTLYFIFLKSLPQSLQDKITHRCHELGLLSLIPPTS